MKIHDLFHYHLLVSWCYTAWAAPLQGSGGSLPTEMRLWGQSYVLPPLKFGRARSEQYKYSKMTTARSKDLTLLGCFSSLVERAPGLSNGNKPTFSPFSSSYTIGEEKRPCVSVPCRGDAPATPTTCLYRFTCSMFMHYMSCCVFFRFPYV